MLTERRPFIAALAALVLAGCAASAGTPSASSTEPAASRPPFETPAPSASDGAGVVVPDGLPDAAWMAILDDLTVRLGEHADPTLVSADAVTWNDGSLGCPKPGQVYTQALIDGFQVVVDVDGEQFDYRVGSGTDVRLCEQ